MFFNPPQSVPLLLGLALPLHGLRLSPLEAVEAHCASNDLNLATMDKKILVTCPLPIDETHPANLSSRFPWTHPRACVDVSYSGDAKFCAYTAADSGPHGISIITIPEHAAHLAGFVADTYQPAAPDVPYQVVDMPGKGRGAVATRAIKKGEPIFNDYAALVLNSRTMELLKKNESDALLQLATDRLAEPHRVYDGARAHSEYGVVMDVIATNAFFQEVEGQSYYKLYPQIAVSRLSLDHYSARVGRLTIQLSF